MTTYICQYHLSLTHISCHKLCLSPSSLSHFTHQLIRFFDQSPFGQVWNSCTQFSFDFLSLFLFYEAMVMMVECAFIEYGPTPTFHADHQFFYFIFDTTNTIPIFTGKSEILKQWSKWLNVAILKRLKH